jgi:CRP-like cAMP-binding protein
MYSSIEDYRKRNKIKYENLKILNEVLRVELGKRTIKNIKSLV